MITNSLFPLVACLGIISFYIIVLIIVGIGLLRLKKPQGSFRHSVSVVIAARNEQDRILPCLEGLEKIEYPIDLLEIILVDDASTDSTHEIMQSFCARNSHWTLLHIKEKSTELKGKKNALAQGIALSRNELLFVTDADCIVPPRWLAEMSRYFGPEVVMVQGYSPLLPDKGVLHKLLEFDNLFSAISLAAPTKMGYPFAGVGRNLAYRRSAYEKVGGFHALKKFRSGDDTHMTERFRSLKAGKIDFCVHPDTFVFTRGPQSKKELFFQQVRKNSRVLTKTLSSTIFSISVFISYMAPFFLLFLAPEARMLWTTLLLFRAGLEFTCLTVAAIKFGQTGQIKYFPLMQILYAPYNIFFSILGTLQLYQWKK